MPAWVVVVTPTSTERVSADTLEVKGDEGTARIVLRFRVADRTIAEFYQPVAWREEANA